MKELIESVGSKKGFSKIDIHNCYSEIDYGIELLIKGDYEKIITIEQIIELAIKYGTSLKLKMKYKNIFSYAMEICY